MKKRGIFGSVDVTAMIRVVAAVLLLQFVLQPFAQLVHHHHHVFQEHHQLGDPDDLHKVSLTDSHGHAAADSKCPVCDYLAHQQPAEAPVPGYRFTFFEVSLKDRSDARVLFSPRRYTDASSSRGPPRS
ncbi:DUF2946 family protein [Pedobacter deserti]|uniref:DUF2946 family protein n=1 Tax=Pedobacter deserti TaxID=2817382 RepID=UPI00210A4917|nr:hypothetical protein [Pedobacter sp. SYSU D00382]